jgi:hypothetical protein
LGRRAASRRRPFDVGDGPARRGRRGRGPFTLDGPLDR